MGVISIEIWDKLCVECFDVDFIYRKEKETPAAADDELCPIAYFEPNKERYIHVDSVFMT